MYDTFNWSKEYLEIANKIHALRKKWDNNLPREERDILMEKEKKLFEEMKIAEKKYYKKRDKR